MTFQSHNPATGEPIGTDPEHDEAETNVRGQGRSVLPNMMQLMNAITPLHEAVSPFPDPGVMRASYLH
jgi:hypothetical protein